MAADMEEPMVKLTKIDIQIIIACIALFGAVLAVEWILTCF